MDAGPDGGELVTRPLSFTGKHLFVNAAAARGELRVAVLDQQGQTIPGFGRDDCQPVHADKTLQMITWRGGDDLSALAGKPIRFRFELTDGRLYAFWVSPDKSGASRGFAGGPAFTAATDTVGAANYAAATPAPAVGAAPQPQLWPRDGHYAGGVSIAIDVPLCRQVEGATCRYTTDGSDPAEASPAYTQPFTLAQAGTFTVKARVFKSPLAPSAIAQGDFEIRPQTKAPVLFAAGPIGDLPGGTRSITVHIRTGESAICRWSDKPGVPFEQMSHAMAFEGHALHEARQDLPGGTLHMAKIDGLREGESRQLYIKARDAYGNTSEKEVSFTVNPTKPQPVEVRMEAESASLDAPMRVMQHIDAIGGQYVASPEAEKGAVTFRFRVPAAGKYVIWTRVMRPADGERSFYVSLDGQEDIFEIAAVEKPTSGKPPVEQWAKAVVTGRQGGKADSKPEPRIFKLSAGDHKLVFRSGQAQSMLDWVIVTNQQ
jgi:hypothetical protein